MARIQWIEEAEASGEAAEVYREHMEAKGRDFLASAGVTPADMVVTRSADMQYVGQMHDISVPIPDGDLDQGLGL